MKEAERAKELRKLGHLLKDTALNFTHQFEEYHPEWGMVYSVGERLVYLAEKEVTE